jgi:hypothetical protein
MDKRKPQPQHKPPKKKKKAKRLEIEAAAIERGRIIGQFQGHKKKPLEESIKEHIGHWIDSINPLETVAVLGTTVLVKRAIDLSEDLTARIVSASQNPKAWYLAFVGMSPLAPLWTSQFLGKEAPEVKQALSSPTAELVEWLMAFSIAYIIVHNAGSIITALGSGAKGLGEMVGFLLPASLA